MDEEEEIAVYSSIIGKEYVEFDFNASQTGHDFWRLYLVDLNGLDNV